MCMQPRFINPDTFCAMFCMTCFAPLLHLAMSLQMTWLSDAVICPLHDSMPVCARACVVSLDDPLAASPLCIASPPLPSSCLHLFCLLVTCFVDKQKLHQETLYVFTLSESPALTCKSLLIHIHYVGTGSAFQGPPPPHPLKWPQGHTYPEKLPSSQTVKGA